METFKRLESEVRSYVRNFPAVFTRSERWHLYDEAGRQYLDFFAGAGALNYGHNEPRMKAKLLEYISGDGVAHTLDMASATKREFLERFDEVILKPRGMHYKVQFPGPTGTNAVEAALKLARKVTGRQTVVSFTNGFHGMTLGSLAITGNAFKREGAGVPLGNGVSMPYDGFLEGGLESLDVLKAYLADKGSGLDAPAAVIVETVQGEGGLNTARMEWLQELERICRAHAMLLIVDDIQAGCGRTGTFFSFEPAGIDPDIVCLSKSISGYGLPMALTLLKPEHDIWAPGEHNGTFRGHNLAFVTATAALEYWRDDAFARHVQERGAQLRKGLEAIAAEHPELKAEVRGRGLLAGLAVQPPELADKIAAAAFERGLVMETSGPDSEVVKVMPPLVIDAETLERGLDLLAESVAATLGKETGKARQRKIA